MYITTTVLPILCLMEWNSPKCREEGFDLPAPKFAPNFRVPKVSTKLPVYNFPTGLDFRESGEYDEKGFFTPVLPKSFKASSTTSTTTTTQAVPTQPILVTTTEKEIVPERELVVQPTTTVLPPTHRPSSITSTPFITTRAKARTAPSFETTLYAVRPTTPMGDSFLTTYKTPTIQQDFPRTALISIASISVIVIIAIVVFCVFRCRQSGPPMDGPYPMVMSGKTPSATAAGYTPIPSDSSPQMHTRHYEAQCPPMGMSNTLPAQMRNGGYQPLKGSVIPNGNSMNVINGQSPGGIIQNGGTDSAKKKEFKEWYV